ncbi:MAG: BlaI/MecI/CopY family transcriptional regulator [Fervidicoccaceae archaeon]
MSILIAALGFDIGHIVRIVSRMYERDMVRIAYLLVSSIRGNVDQRSSAAIADLSKILQVLKIRVEPIVIEILDPDDAVKKILDLVERASKELRENEELIISLAGGTRALVSYTAMAIVHIIPKLARVSLVWEVEGGGPEITARGEIVGELVTHIYGREAVKPEIVVLETLKELGKAKLSEIHRKLEEKGYRWTKQYTYKILKNLEEKGQVTRISRGRYMATQQAHK